jgi:DNA-directed RNA polymerase subunit beta'
MIDFLVSEDISHLPRVSSTNIVDRKRKTFDKDGIFSEEIFGGSNEIKCTCGELKGKFYLGNTCPHCNTIVEENSFDKEAVLKLPEGMKIFNPIILEMIRRIEFDLLEAINPAKRKIDQNGNGSEEESILSFSYIANNYEDFVKNYIKNKTLRKFLKKRKESFLVDFITVLPLHLRNASIDKNITQIILDDINKFYIVITTHIQSLENLDGLDSGINIELELYELQKVYNSLAENVTKIIAEKEGIIRDQILSNRINFSGRAVIILDPVNDPLSIVIPKIMFMEIYLAELLIEIKEIGEFFSLTEASNYYYMNRFDTENNIIKQSVNILVDKQQMVVLIRNPSLHLKSIQSFYIREVIDEDVIKIPKTCFADFNADIDGDTEGLFSVHTKEAKEEAKLLMFEENIFSHKRVGINSNIMPDQDNALGLFYLDYKNTITKQKKV